MVVVETTGFRSGDELIFCDLQEKQYFCGVSVDSIHPPPITMPSIEKSKKKFHSSLNSLKACLLRKPSTKTQERQRPQPPEDKDPESRYFTACVQEDHCEREYATRMPNGHIYDQYGTLHILPPPEYTEYEEVAEIEVSAPETQKTSDVVATPSPAALPEIPQIPQIKLTKEQRRVMLVLMALFLIYSWGWPLFVMAIGSVAVIFPRSWHYVLGPQESRKSE